MTTTDRDNIATRVAILLGFITRQQPTPGDTQEAADAGASLLADVLTDVNRIADAVERLTTFDFKRVGDVAIGGFPSDGIRAEFECQTCGATPGQFHAESCYIVQTIRNPTPVPWNGQPGGDNEPLTSQVERLAQFIVHNFPGEPSQSQGAIDTAIRLLTKSQAHKREIREHFKIPPDVKIMDYLKGLDDYTPASVPGSAEDFAAFLTVQPDEIKVGASNTVYAVFDAVKKYRERLDNPVKPA